MWRKSRYVHPHQTYRGYIDNHIKPNIGSIPLEKLTTMELQKLYRKLLTSGRVERIEAEKQPKGLSAKMVRNINQVISSAMDLAVAQKIILENPPMPAPFQGWNTKRYRRFPLSN